MISLPTNSDPRSETGKDVLASQAGHWYHLDGRPCYEVETKKGGMRPTTIADARNLDLVPSVTAILNIAAKPGLEAWKAKQILESALTLPRKLICEVINGKPVMTEESLDDYAVRVIEDSKAQGQKARDKGTELHAAIEEYILGNGDKVLDIYSSHISKLDETLGQQGINLFTGHAEHSFASPLGYGGKIDFHNDEPLVLDFKTKDKIDDKKQLVWPEHVQQLAAYGMGMFSQHVRINRKFRAINVFIGVQDKQVRVMEHEWPDIVEAFEQFKLLLAYWQRSKKFGPYAKGKQ